jgi:hypothetical protein
LKEAMTHKRALILLLLPLTNVRNKNISEVVPLKKKKTEVVHHNGTLLEWS